MLFSIGQCLTFSCLLTAIKITSKYLAPANRIAVGGTFCAASSLYPL